MVNNIEDKRQRLLNKVTSMAGKLYWRKIGRISKDKYVNFPYGKNTYNRTSRQAVLDTLKRTGIQLSRDDIFRVSLFIAHGES